MKIVASEGNQQAVDRLIVAFKNVEDANEALQVELRRYEEAVTIYKLPQYGAPPYAIKEKGMHSTVLAHARLLVAKADNSIALAHMEVTEKSFERGILVGGDGGGGK